MRIDWRKKELVYSGIEHCSYRSGYGDEIVLGSPLRADMDLRKYLDRTLTEEEFTFYYWVGMELREMGD
jgi:hypothetical protein